ncbi:MAG TPA: type II toxin-antitoxin system RatA family toxin [Caulobacteraceae bacterium]|nr:type II toxin-antitoxin system RatA family toxin [Caulobacteraceae bacterium]
MPYAPEQLFRLVGDVQAYPEFVPWIARMRVTNPATDGPGVDFVDAEAEVRFAFLSERFSTRVRRDANRLEILVGLIRGPFRRLDNRWAFSAHPVGSLVEFRIEFEFNSRLLDALLAANLGRAVDRLIACFEDRAKALYG